MTDAEDVDLLQDDIADLALLQAEPVVDAEAEATEPKTEEPQAEEAQTEDDVLEKKKARSQGSASTANKAKRVPIPVPPHAKAAEEAPAPKPAPVKPATKPAPPSRPESVAVARGSSKTGRYFVMKSVSAPNVDYSIANGVWATQVCIVTHPLLSGQKNLEGPCLFVFCELLQEPWDSNIYMTHQEASFLDRFPCHGHARLGFVDLRSSGGSQPLLAAGVCEFQHHVVEDSMKFPKFVQQGHPEHLWIELLSSV